jgi:hypothetical protein
MQHTMEREKQTESMSLTSIHINLVERTIELEDQYGTVGRLVLGETKVLYEGAPLAGLQSADPPAAPTRRAARRPAAHRPPHPASLPDYLGQPDPRTLPHHSTATDDQSTP